MTSLKQKGSRFTAGKFTRRGLIGAAAASSTLLMNRWFAFAEKATDKFKGQTLNVLTWPGHGEPYMVALFEERYGVRVRVKEYVGGDQLLAIVNSTPAGTYDVILADAEVVEQLVAAQQIERLNAADYPISDFWPEFRKFPLHWYNDQLYAVMLRFGYLGIAYNSKQLSAEDVSSYKILWEPKVTRKVGWFDWYLPSMGCLSLYDGNKAPYDISNENFDKLKKTLFSLKPQTSGFLQMAELFSSFAGAQIWAVAGIGDWVALLLEDQGHPIKATVPKEAACNGLSHCRSPRAREIRNWQRRISSTRPLRRVRYAPRPLPLRGGHSEHGRLEAHGQREACVGRSTASSARPAKRHGSVPQGQYLDSAVAEAQPIAAWNEAWTEFET